MFLGYSRLLVTTWLHEPAIIPVSNILHVNVAAQYSPVLIQAYGVHEPAQTHIIPFPFRPDTPSKNLGEVPTDLQFRNHPAIKFLSNFINLENNCGYLTFANIGVLDFGCQNKEITVKLGKRQPPIMKQGKAEPLSIANENFSFTKELNSPDESHFALTPVSTSPANGFTSKECSELLQQELDELEHKMKKTVSIDGLMSPVEENISMFSINEEMKSPDDNRGEVNIFIYIHILFFVCWLTCKIDLDIT